MKIFFKFKNMKFSAVMLAATVVLASCGGAQDPLDFKNSAPPPPMGSERTDNNNELTPDEQAAVGDCIPGVPVNGSTITLNTVGFDPQYYGDSAADYFPNGTAQVTYKFSDGKFDAETSQEDRLAYIPPLGGLYNQDTGLVEANDSAIIDPAGTESAIALNPSDWAQQLARKLNSVEPGSPNPASIQLKLSARGKLPKMLSELSPTAADFDASKDFIGAEYTVQAWRDDDTIEIINGVPTSICNFHFTIDKPYQVDPNLIITTGNIALSSPPWSLAAQGLKNGDFEPSEANQEAAVAGILAEGPALSSFIERFNTDVGIPYAGKLFMEPYIPSFKGTFSTSSSIPFFPVKTFWVHTYGISSQSDPGYKNAINPDDFFRRLVFSTPDGKSATQEFTFVSVTTGGD